MLPQTDTQNWLKPPNRHIKIDSSSSAFRWYKNGTTWLKKTLNSLPQEQRRTKKEELTHSFILPEKYGKLYSVLFYLC